VVTPEHKQSERVEAGYFSYPETYYCHKRTLTSRFASFT
jgi:hypothetical protein